MRIQWFLFLPSTVALLVSATPIPSPTNGGTNTNNQNLSRSTTPPLSSSPSIVDKQSHNKKPLKEVILTEEQRTEIQSWEEEMKKWNPSNFQEHEEGVETVREQGQREGKDPEKVANGYKWKRMADNRAKRAKSSKSGNLQRGRPGAEIDPIKFAKWEAKLKENEKRWKTYLGGLKKVERENKEDVGKAVERYRNARYRADQAQGRFRDKKREGKKDVQGGTSGSRSEFELVTTHGQYRPATPATAPAPYTRNEDRHPEEEKEGDEGLPMSFDFQLYTD